MYSRVYVVVVSLGQLPNYMRCHVLFFSGYLIYRLLSGQRERVKKKEEKKKLKLEKREKKKGK